MTQELEKLPPVAKSVHLFCKKCDTDRFHTVVAHKTATSAKVQCEVCKSSKTFSIKAKKASAAKKTTTRTRSKKASSQNMWMDLQQQHGTEGAIRYNIKIVFDSNGIIDHPKFGLGYITEVLPDRIHVVFEDGEKDLIHSR